MILSKNIFSLILFSIPLALFGQDSIDLSLHFIPNDTFSYRFTFESIGNSLDYTMNTTKVQEEKFHIKKVRTDGSAEVEVTFARQICKRGEGETMSMFDTNYPDTTNNYFNEVGYLYMKEIGKKKYAFDVSKSRCSIK